MTVTISIVIALMVLFGALLMGKMLKDLFPGSVFAYFKRNAENDSALN